MRRLVFSMLGGALGRGAHKRGVGTSPVLTRDNLGSWRPARRPLWARQSSSRSRRAASLAGFFDLSHTFDGPLR